MKLVRARARDHVHHGTAREAILRAEIGLLNLELLHGFRGWQVCGRRDAAIWFRIGG